MVFRNAIPYIVGGAILVGASFVVLNGRSQREFEKGEAFEREGNLTDAIERYEWAIQAYSPLGSYPSQALERLRTIAQEAEVSGATETAMEAWQAILSGLAVIENIRQPYEADLREAEERLAELRGKTRSAPPEVTP